MSKFVIAAALFVLGVLHISSVAMGADACKKESKDACADLSLSPTQLKKCLKEKKNKVSNDCKEKGPSLKAKLIGGMQACKADAEKFCAEADGLSKTKKCLKEHLSELSALCKAQMSGGGSNNAVPKIPGF